MRPLCDGDRNAELGINLDNATCRDEGVFPEYGIHAGCPPNSPFLGDVLNAFDSWVAEGNPAFVTLRFKDFTTSGFVPEWAEAAVQDQLNSLIKDTLGRNLFVPEEGVDYSDVANWPSLKEVVGSGKRLVIFSNSTSSSFVFDDALLDEEDFVGSAPPLRRREERKTPVERDISKRQTEPFFDYTIDVAQRIVIQGVTVTESGTPLLPNDVSPILSEFRTPSILRLSYDHLDELVWGFDETVAFNSDLECVISDPARGYRWYQSDCDQNYRVACAVDNTAPFTFGEVQGNDYGSRDGNDFCNFPALHSAPTSPEQQDLFAQQASGISEPIYLNIRFTTDTKECDCDSGCWTVPQGGISGLPLSSFCVAPQIEITNPVDTEPIADDDDDLTGGEIAAIVIVSVFAVLLLLLLLLFLMFSKGGSNEVTGRVGVVDEDDEDDERYKQGRGALTTADTKAATNIEYPETGVDLDAQVDLGQEEEATGPANKRKIGALEVSSQSMRDYRNEVAKD